MPDGSSSAAPVIKPGPSLRRNRVTGFFDLDSFVAVEGVSGESGASFFNESSGAVGWDAFARGSNHPPRNDRNSSIHPNAP
jgi:hypothetical protein